MMKTCRTRNPKVVWTLAALLAAYTGRGQGYVDQKAVAPLLALQTAAKAPEAIQWHEYTFPASAKTAPARLAHLRQHLKSLPGELKEYRMAVVEISNRVTSKYFPQKSKPYIPDSFVADFRAYSPAAGIKRVKYVF